MKRPPLDGLTGVPHVVYNLGNNQPRALEELISGIEQALGRKGDRANSRPSTGAMCRPPMPILKAAAVIWAFPPETPLEEGLRRFVNWFPRLSWDSCIMIARTKPRLVFLVTEDWYFWSHRLPMARAARDAGFEVLVACRVTKHGELIRQEGFSRLSAELAARASFNPLGLLAAVREITALYRQTARPISFTILP